jgi:hypothetical protein
MVSLPVGGYYILVGNTYQTTIKGISRRILGEEKALLSHSPGIKGMNYAELVWLWQA